MSSVKWEKKVSLRLICYICVVLVIGLWCKGIQEHRENEENPYNQMDQLIRPSILQKFMNFLPHVRCHYKQTEQSLDDWMYCFEISGYLSLSLPHSFLPHKDSLQITHIIGGVRIIVFEI
jgi:hypothetical protein